MKTDPKRPDLVIREDGCVAPAALLADLRTVAAIDGIAGVTDDSLLSHIRFVRYVKLPPISDVIYEAQKERECPNCLGEAGKGMLYAPTAGVGSETDRKHAVGFSHYTASGKLSPFNRGLVAYPCPVCSNPDQNIYLTRCGIYQEAILSGRAPSQYHRNLRDHTDPTKSRVPIERVIDQFVEAVGVEKGGGLFAVVGPRGCGKTWLAEFATLQLARMNVDVRYIRADELWAQIMTEMAAPEFTGMPKIVHSLMGRRVIVIDQFERFKEVTASGHDTEAARWVQHLLDDRYTHRDRKAVLIAVNNLKWDSYGEGGPLTDIYDRFRAGVYGVSTYGGIRDALGVELTDEGDTEEPPWYAFDGDDDA